MLNNISFLALFCVSYFFLTSVIRHPVSAFLCKDSKIPERFSLRTRALLSLFLFFFISFLYRRVQRGNISFLAFFFSCFV